MVSANENYGKLLCLSNLSWV